MRSPLSRRGLLAAGTGPAAAAAVPAVGGCSADGGHGALVVYTQLGTTTPGARRRPATTGRSEVAAGVLVHDDGRGFVRRVSRSAEETKVRPECAGRASRDPDSGEPVVEVRLAPYGARVSRLG